ncbi:MAG: hypothetical protein M3Y58_10955 [Chloroflexota bacterium]|nr:hypothetical protein [Chloroflexota bacterium]
MDRPLLLLTTEDLVLVLILLVAVALALTLRHRRPAERTDATHDAGIAGVEEALAPAYDQLRALEAIEARTLRAVADHRARITAMRQQLHGTPEEQELLDEVQRLTFAAITAHHDRALTEALTMRGDDA